MMTKSTLQSRFFLNLFKTIILIESVKKPRFLIMLMLLFFGLVIYIKFKSDILSNTILEFESGVTPIYSLYIFCLSTTIALYIFLYRERKDVSKNNLNNSLQYYIFIITVVILFFNLFLSYFWGNNTFLIIISLIFYLINFIFTLIYSDIYMITKIRIKLLTNFMKVYIASLNKYSDDGTGQTKFNSVLKIMLILILISLVFIHFTFNLIIGICLSLVVILFFLLPNFFNLRKDNNNIVSCLTYLTSKSFSTQSGISYVNGNIEKNSEVELKSLILTYNELIKQILLGDDQKLHKLVLYQSKHQDAYEIMSAFYDNTLTTYKEIVLSANIDQDVNETFATFLYEMSPVVVMNNINEKKIPNEIVQLNNEYSQVYTKVMIELLTEFFLDIKGNKAAVFRGYFEQTLTDIQVSKILKNEEKFVENAVKIECTVLANLLLKNNLHGVIAIMPSIIEKKNLNIDGLDQKYLEHLIMLLIKSVEIEHLKISGYLVKIICSNYSPTLINKCFYQIKKRHSITEGKTRNDEWFVKFHTIGNEDIFIISGPSLEYCFFKSYLVLKIYNDHKTEFDLSIKEDLYYRLFNKIKEDLTELDISKDTFDRYEKSFPL